MASLIEEGRVDSVLKLLESSPSPADYTIAYSLLMRSPHSHYIPRLIELGRQRFGSRFMTQEAFQYYMDTGNLAKALEEVNRMYGLQSVREKFLWMEDKFDGQLWKALKDLKNPSPTLRRVAASILIERGQYPLAVEMARTFDDTLQIAKFLMEKQQYQLVADLLKDNYRRRKTATKLYGLSLYHLGRYREAARILERIDPQLASRAYYMAGDLEKAEKLTADTATLIRAAFKRGQYDRALQLCQRDFVEECVAAVLFTHPDSAMEVLARLSSGAKRVSPATGILVQIATTYPKETVKKFMENVFLGKNHQLDEDLHHLSLALREDLRGHRDQAIEHYQRVKGWAEPFALYRLYRLTGKRQYRDQLLDKYPQSAYAIMVSRS